jgi:WD40 repeat protein
LKRDLLVSASEDGQVRIHPLTGGPAKETLYLDSAGTALVLIPGGELLTGEATGALNAWLPTGQSNAARPLIFSDLETGNEVSFNSEGTKLLVKGWGEYLGVYDLQRHEPSQVRLPGMGETLARFRPRHNQVVVGYTNAIRLFRPDDSGWQLLREVSTVGTPVRGYFNEMGDWLALSYPWYAKPRRERSFDLLYLGDRQRLEALDVPDATSSSEGSIALSADGTHVAVLSAWTSRLWLRHTGHSGGPGGWQLSDEMPAGVPAGVQNGMTFHPRENVLAAGGPGFAIGVWDLARKTSVRWLRGHRANVAGLTFSPDGNRLASASFDHTVRIWDWRLGEELLVLQNKNYYAICCAFSPDGLQLANTDSVPPAWLRTAVPWWQDAGDHERKGAVAEDPVLENARRLRLTGTTLEQAQRLLEAGDRDKATEQCQAVFDLRRSLLGDNHPATLGAREQLRLARTPGKTNSLPPQSN